MPDDRSAFLRRVTDALSPLADPLAVVAEACRLLGEHLEADRVYYVEVNEAEGVATIHQDYLRGDSPSPKGRQRVTDVDWVIPPLRRGDTLVIPDLAGSPPAPLPDRPAMATARVAAQVIAPLVKVGVLVGAVCVTEPAPRDWTAAEVTLVEDTAERLWAAVARAKAEAAARERQAFLELVAGLGSDWWFSARIEPDGTAVTESVSDGFTRLLGYTPDELMTAGGWSVIVHPADRPAADRQMARLMAGETIDGELRHVTRDGRVTWSLYRTRPERDAAGRVVRVHGVARDITAHKRAEDDRRESEARFRGLAESMPQAVWSSTDHVVDYFNSRWWAYTGLDPATGLGEAWHAVVHPDDRPTAVERSARSSLTGADFETEYRLRRADGEYRWHIARAVRVPELGRWFGTATDIHDLRQALDSLRERDEQLALAQRAAGLGVSTLDLATGVGVTTPEWRHVTAMPDPPAPQDFATFLNQVHPDDRQRVADLHRPPPADGLEFEFRVNHPDLGERWVLSRSRVLPTAGGPGRLVGIALDVTDRRRADERVRSVAVNLPGAAAFVVDTDLRYTLAGGGALTAAGLSPADFEGKTVADAVGPGLAAEYEANFRRALGGETFHWEHQTHGRHFLTHLTPLRDAGRVTAALAVSYDITDRVRAEEKLKRAEHRLRLALTAARMGIWTWDVGRDLHSRDENLCCLLGLPAADAEDSADLFLARVHPHDRDRVRAGFRAAAERGESFALEFRVVRPDGSVRWLRDQGDVVRGPDGRATHLTGACVDVTDRVAAEAGVRASEERLRRIVESATDYAIITLARDRSVTSWSPGATAVFGYAAEEVAGRSADMLFTPEDRAACGPEQEAEQARRTGRAAAERWHVKKDGSRFFASGVLTPLGEGDGGFVKVARDLTARKRLEEQLERRVGERTAELASAVDALETEIARRRQLARRLATAQEGERRRVARDLHDTLGQLQTGLALAVAAVRRVPHLPAAASERLVELERLADELARETHALAVRLRPTALDDLGLIPALRQLVADWFLRTGIGGEFDTAEVDAGRLPAEVETAVYRLVQEALTNVARHAHASRVAVSVGRPNGHMFVLVEDDGVGFDPDATGAGRLGLVGMRERVELAGGTLSIESATETGTTILARFPLPDDSP